MSTFRQKNRIPRRLKSTEFGGRPVHKRPLHYVALRRCSGACVPKRTQLGSDINGAANSATMALFCPHRTINVTAGGAEGRLQLWRASNALDRWAVELGQLVPIRNVSAGKVFRKAFPFLVPFSLYWPPFTAWRIQSRISRNCDSAALSVNVERRMRGRTEIESAGMSTPGTRFSLSRSSCLLVSESKGGCSFIP